MAPVTASAVREGWGFGGGGGCQYCEWKLRAVCQSAGDVVQRDHILSRLNEPAVTLTAYKTLGHMFALMTYAPMHS